MRVVNSTPRPLHPKMGPIASLDILETREILCPYRDQNPEPSIIKHGVIPTMLSRLNSSLECHETSGHFMEPEASSPLSQNLPLSASYARSIPSTIPCCFLNTRLTLLSHLCLGLPSGLFPPGFPNSTYNNTKSKTQNAVPYVTHV